MKNTKWYGLENDFLLILGSLESFSRNNFKFEVEIFASLWRRNSPGTGIQLETSCHL